jgi:hypothetical protein
MPKMFKAFRFNPELYENFKKLTVQNGYTLTAALEKFMSCCVDYGVLAFPQAPKAEDLDAQARILLAWFKKGQHWYSKEGEDDQVSVSGRLLELLPKVHDARLKKEIEEALKKA